MNVAQQTLDALKLAMAAPSDSLAKAFTQSGSATTGLTYYDLEAPAKTLYPVLTPLRNEIPRVSGRGGIQANWKAVTGINTGKIGMGVMEGARGRVISTTVAEYLAAYRGIGLEDSATFESQYAGQNYEDIRARATEGLLRAFMLGEEALILGGNGTRSFGVTPTPTVAASTTGGTIPANTYGVICIALSLEAYLGSSVGNGVPVSGNVLTADGQTQFVRTGAAQQSVSSTTGLTTGSTSSVTASVAPVQGAVAYAWYIGVAGSERLVAITTINSVLITALNGAGQLASLQPAADYSANTAVFDGFLAFASDPSKGGYVKTMATGTAGTGTPLTGSGDGGISEFDAALQSFWDNYRLSPDEIWVSSQEQKNIKTKIMAAPSTAAARFNFTMDKEGMIGGSMAVSYLNPFTMGGAASLPIKLHPNMPAGTVMFRTKQLPYVLNNVPNVAQILARQDYYAIEWPLKTRKWEFGVYADEVLQCYAPFSLGIITNIANG